jgi:hypothetical protein
MAEQPSEQRRPPRPQQQGDGQPENQKELDERRSAEPRSTKEDREDDDQNPTVRPLDGLPL